MAIDILFNPNSSIIAKTTIMVVAVNGSKRQYDLLP
jgi:hypothetical protein